MVAFTLINVQVAEAAQDKLTVSKVRKMLKDGTFDSEKSCLDEYAKRSTQLAVKVGLVPPGGAAVSAGAGLLAYLGVGFGAAASGAGLAALFLAIFFGGVALAAGIGGVLVWEGLSIAQLVRNNTILKSVAESYDASGKNFDKFVRKYFRTYRKDQGKFTKEQVAAAIVKGDEAGVYCDGSLTGSTKSLKKKLAKNKQIFQYVNKQLNQ